MEKQQNKTTAQKSTKASSKQPDPEREHKRAWLNRYQESLAAQRRLVDQLEEARSRSTSICVSLNPAKAAPTNMHTDRVADSAQQIIELERKLQNEQQRGEKIRVEIIGTLFDQQQLTINQINVLCCQYIDGIDCAQTAAKTGLNRSTISGYRHAALTAFELPESA